MSATESNTNAGPDEPGHDREPTGLEYATIENADGEVECTVFPRDCDDAEIVTHWLTAGEGSFVALDAVR